jgi:hypothetical protein
VPGIEELGASPIRARHSTFEEVYPNDKAEWREPLAGLNRYLTCYYHGQLHQSLGYGTPTEVYSIPERT